MIDPGRRSHPPRSPARLRGAAASWLLLAVAAAALAVYLLRPDDAPPPPEALWAGQPPTALRLRSDGREQTVAGARVRLGVLDRPADAGRIDALFAALGRIAAPPERVQTAAAADLRSFGIDPAQRAVEADGLALAWGERAGDRFAAARQADGRWRVLPADAESYQAVQAAAGRLDRRELVADAERAVRVELRYAPADGAGAVSGLTLERSDGAWVAPAARQRPPFSTRVDILLGLIAVLELERPDAAAGVVPELAAIRLGLPDGATAAIAIDRAWRVAADGSPAQVIPEPARALWREALADFAGDRLFDLPIAQTAEMSAAIFLADGVERFRLERRTLAQQQLEERTPWAFIWPEGREDARADAGELVARAFDRVRIRQPEAAPAPARAGREIRLIGKDRATIIARLIIEGDVAIADGWRGRIVELPALLREPGAEAFLDPRLTIIPPQRAVKLQRIVRDEGPARGETYAQGDGRAWSRTWPTAGPADAAAIRRLLHALCGTVGRSCRLATDADRAALAAPALELDVRFAPKPGRKGANDVTEPEDTVPTDLGLAIVPDPDQAGMWRAVERSGGRSWLLDPDAVEALRMPLAERVVLPVPTALLTAARWEGPGGRWILRRDGERWLRQAIVADAAGRDQPGEAIAVDPVAVRRWLRELGQLRQAGADPGAAALAPGEIAGRLVCTVPGPQALPEQIVISIGRPAAGVAPLSYASHRADAQLPPGRVLVAPAAVDVLLPPGERFPAVP